MLTDSAVKIPEIPGKISIKTTEGREYVQYLLGRRYNRERQYNEPDRVVIGRKIEEMPGMMIPNDNYEKYFEPESGETESELTAEEQIYLQNNTTYGLYVSFFDGLYHEFKQQARKKADDPVNSYKAESINGVLAPLREMMAEEAYAQFLGLIETGNGEDGDGMSYSDAMILMTQYKSALGKYHRSHPQWNRD